MITYYLQIVTLKKANNKQQDVLTKLELEIIPTQ